MKNGGQVLLGDRRNGRPSRRAVSEWTLDQLYDLIFSGEAGAGTAIREEELTARLGVSRAPVRESLRQLEVDGLLDVDQESGRRRVVQFGLPDVYELYMIRTGLEEISARHAAPRMTSAVLDELKILELRMEQEREDRGAVQRRQRDFRTDIEFHRLICKTSGLTRSWRDTVALLGADRSLAAPPVRGGNLQRLRGGRSRVQRS